MTEPSLPAAYEFVRHLGAGAFGDVSLARHVGLGRLVAIKRLHRFALADDHALDRFRREATVLAALRSRDIVRVYDFVSTDSEAFMIMEFVEGRDFSSFLRRVRLGAGQAIPILADVARALDVAARAGIVHRDVKPGNVFVLNGGGAKLGDFGLARAVVDPRIFRTTDGALAGTPAYFPPEVSQGAEPDERSDAYSFAVMAYEALTGRLPIDGDDAMALIAAHWTRPVPRPESWIPGFPGAAGDALLAGLSKDPAQRPLPHQLVALLAAVPAADWPAAPPLSARAGEEQDTRGAATRLGGPSFGPVRPAAALPTSTRPAKRHRGTRGWRWAGASVLVLAVAGVAAVVLTRPTRPATVPLRVEHLVVTTEPHHGQGACPRTTFTVNALITTNGSSGALTVSFSLFGRRTPTQRVALSGGQRSVRAHALFPVAGPKSRAGRSSVRVAVGMRVMRSGAAVEYRC